MAQFVIVILWALYPDMFKLLLELVILFIFQCAESNQIFCNGVPLEKEVVSERDSDDSYVYDLYYTNSHNFDFRLLENVLTVEAIRQDYRTAEEEADGEEGGYEDEDSNDEGNWRNDYPEDDPGFIDNQDVGYYGNGKYIEASSWDYGTYHICDQRRLRWACAFAQSHQSLRCSHP